MARDPKTTVFERDARALAARLEHRIGRFSYASTYRATRHATCSQCGKVFFYDSSDPSPRIFSGSYVLELCAGKSQTPDLGNSSGRRRNPDRLVQAMSD